MFDQILIFGIKINISNKNSCLKIFLFFLFKIIRSDWFRLDFMIILQCFLQEFLNIFIINSLDFVDEDGLLLGYNKKWFDFFGVCVGFISGLEEC